MGPRQPAKGAGSLLRITLVVDRTVTVRLDSSPLSRLDYISAHDSRIARTLQHLGYAVSVVYFDGDPGFIHEVADTRPDVVFNLACSTLPEEAGIVAILELLGLPVVGSDARGIQLSSDKAISKHILRGVGVAVPQFLSLEGAREVDLSRVGLPAIVKPLRSGGSHGITRSSVVRSASSLQRRIDALQRRFGECLIVEEFISGRDMTLGVVGDRQPIVLPPREMRFPEGSAQLQTEHNKRNQIAKAVAPRLSASVRRSIQQTAELCIQSLSLRDYAAIDFRLTDDNEVVVVDVNANPALLPFSGRWRSMAFPALLKHIVDGARQRGDPRDK